MISAGCVNMHGGCMLHEFTQSYTLVHTELAWHLHSDFWNLNLNIRKLYARHVSVVIREEFKE